jgi:NAD(P)H-nitrite reductase large subunit
LTNEKAGYTGKRSYCPAGRGDLCHAPHIPGGFINIADFKKLVGVAEKYNAAAMKITSAQRIAIIGIKEEDIDAAWQDLGMSIGHAIGVCVRMVKFCPGTAYCRYGLQDAIGLGIKLDKLYHGYSLPAKFKIGVSGCENSCTAPALKEIGFKGSSQGWTVTAGGNCGAKPRIGQVVAENISDEEALDLAKRIISFFEKCEWANKMRMARVIEKLAFDEFKKMIAA